MRGEKPTESVHKLKQIMKKQSENVKIDAAEEIRKSEGSIEELVAQSEETLTTKLIDCCVTIEDKSTNRFKHLEIDLVCMHAKESRQFVAECFQESCRALVFKY